MGRTSIGAWAAATWLAVLAFCQAACAGTTSKAVQETTEFMLRRFGSEAAKEGAETLARRLEGMAARYGEETLLAARKAGPAGLRALEEAGEHAPDVARLLARHGDQALWVVAKPGRVAIFVRYGEDAAAAMVRHRQLAAAVIEQFGGPAAKAMKSLGGQSARRLAMMAEAGELRQLGRVEELLEIIGRYGNRAMTFVWEHKGALTLTAALTAFLVNPEAFLSGARDLAGITADAIVKPVAEIPAKVAGEVARGTNWTVIGALAIGAAVLFAVGGVADMRRRWARAGPAEAKPD